MLSKTYNENLNFKLSSFMYIPNIIEIEFNLDNLWNDIIKPYTFDYKRRIGTLEYPSSEGLTIQEENRQDKVYEQGLLGEESDIRNYFDMAETNFEKFKLCRCIEDFGIDSIDNCMEEFDELTEEEFNSFFMNENKKTNISDLVEREKEIYFNKYNNYFEFDFIDSKDRRYNNLSYGEKTLFGQLLNMFSCLLNNDSNLFLFDEPDISLHPQWQKNYLNEVISLFKKMDSKSHFIFTTHSPFLLSDLPKENIRCLKDGKEVKGIQKKQTFGANIHTLLSDSFFMEDGLMGEFAKGKINRIKRFYDVLIKYKENEKFKKGYKWLFIKNQKKFWQIQKIIGEPFLQKIVKNQLEEIALILLGKDEAIDKEIARLQDLKKSIK